MRCDEEKDEATCMNQEKERKKERTEKCYRKWFMLTRSTVNMFQNGDNPIVYHRFW